MPLDETRQQFDLLMLFGDEVAHFGIAEVVELFVQRWR
jgi:hypothetical protein